jgi:CrcB protein
VAQVAGVGFPYGTISINTLGSLLIALIMGLSLRTQWVHPDLRLFLTTGIMGGFTTYSTFNYETLALAQQGAWGLAAANVGVTVVLCLGGGVLGLLLARLLAGG